MMIIMLFFQAKTGQIEYRAIFPCCRMLVRSAIRILVVDAILAAAAQHRPLEQHN